jgi:putative sugar O-methyltransferase
MDLIESQPPKSVIADEQELLNTIVKAATSALPIYSPGDYWELKTKKSVSQLNKLGLINFRSKDNTAATSFGDNPNISVLNTLSNSTRGKLKSLLLSMYPFKELFENQVQLTLQHFNDTVTALNAYYSLLPRVEDLLTRYPIDFDTTIGGCETFILWKGQKISHLYLKLLDTLDQMNTKINLKSVRNLIEIGGGFGVNIDLQLHFFPNIRKIIYVDIAPNLYVGTQYLRSKFGSSVIDFNKTKDLETIRFKNDESLEIICILPMQIERVDANFDLVHNAHSFVEMSSVSVRNYGTQIRRLLGKDGQIYLVTYDGFDERTIHPEELQDLLAIPLSISLVPTLMPEKFDYHMY